MKKLFIFACLLLLFFANSEIAFTQVSLTSPGKYYFFKNYSTQNGLINNNINSITQDSRDFIWIGSDLGLTRFDGKSFFHKAIPEIYSNSAKVQYLDLTDEGYLILTSFMQGIFVQQKNEQFKKFLKRGYVELGKNVFNSLKFCSDKSILASESRTIYRITGDSIKQLYDYGRNMALFHTFDLDKDDRIWFGGRIGLGVLQLSRDEYEPVFIQEFQNKYIEKILFDQEGTLHVATSQGYCRIKWKTDGKYIIERPFEIVKDNFINDLYLDKERNLWILTSTFGVLRTKGDDITLHLTQESGLLSSTVLCMMQDREGNYWFGTNNGISMIENFDNYAIAQNGVRFKEAEGMKADVYNRIWIYSGSQLHIFQDDKLISVNLKRTPLEKTGIHTLEIFDKELIISNISGLYQLQITKELPDLKKISKIADYQANNITMVSSLRMDTSGIWISAQTKIFNFFNGKLVPVTFNHRDSLSLRPSMMLQDKYGYFWYGDFTNGLYRGVLSRHENNKILFDSLTVFKSLKADSAFVTAWIQDMCFDKEGNLWFSSLHTGVYKLTIGSSGVISDKLYSVDNGLLSNNVGSISCDDEGKMYFSTQKGINILQYDSSGKENIYKLDRNEGIEGIVSESLQMDDRLFILTDEGIFITNNQLFNKKNINSPKAFITNLLINGIANSDFLANPNDISLSHSQNNLTIEFSAITFKNASDVRYQYKLEGADNKWSALSDRGFVEYASLRPGKYVFRVRAKMGEIGEYPLIPSVALGFRIFPAFYQTVWFYSLVAIFVFSLLYALFRFRLKQLLKMERMRMRIASDLHDDIGSTLSSISMISEIASLKDKDSESAKALSKIGIDSRVVLNSMDDIIWSVNPKNDSLLSLIVRLREYAIPVCELKNITFKLNAGENIDSIKLEMYERRNIFLITKEAINNAVKYSICTVLTVDFIAKNKQLEITISDNGCGFDTTKRGARNGITNMERRAKQIGMDFSIKSEKNKGTLISLKSKNHINI